MSHGVTRRNVIANLLGGASSAVLSIIFVPLYLRFLGAEAFGLVGVLAALQAIFGILDLGLGAMVNREMARLSVRQSDGTRERDLLRTLELVYWGLAATSLVVVFAFAGTIASQWIHAQHLALGAVKRSLLCMGIIIASQLPFSLYQAGLLGRERQVILNVIVVSAATFRNVGALVLISMVAPSIELFFEWQAIVMLLQLAVTGIILWHDLPGPRRNAHVRMNLLTEQWKFSAAVSGNAILGVILTQTDKMLLSGMLPLAEFGYYTLAGSVAAVLWYVINPMAAAYYPRFTRALHAGDEATIVAVYHRACQFLAVLLLPLSVTIACFAHQLITLWTHNESAASASGTIATLLVCGTTMTGLATLPGYFAMAAGFAQIITYTNLISVIVLTPSLLLMVPRYGAIAAATIWVILCSFFIVFTVPMLHGRVIPGEKWRWYANDFAKPLAAALAVGLVSRLLVPIHLGQVAMLGWLAGTGACITIATAAVLPHVRGIVVGVIQGQLGVAAQRSRSAAAETGRGFGDAPK